MWHAVKRGLPTSGLLPRNWPSTVRNARADPGPRRVAGTGLRRRCAWRDRVGSGSVVLRAARASRVGAAGFGLWTCLVGALRAHGNRRLARVARARREDTRRCARPLHHPARRQRALVLAL